MNRRRLMQSQSGELPSGYKRCKYLEIDKQSRHQRIVLGFTWEKVYHIQLFITILQRDYINHGIFLTSRHQTRDEGSLPYIAVDRTSNDILVGGVIRCRCSYDGNLFIAESLMVGNAYKNSLFMICGWCDSAGGHSWTLTYNYGICEVVNIDGDLIFKGIPSLDPSGKPCMYDTVTKQPFYNQGTGEFGYELLDGTYVAPV